MDLDAESESVIEPHLHVPPPPEPDSYELPAGTNMYLQYTGVDV